MNLNILWITSYSDKKWKGERLWIPVNAVPRSQATCTPLLRTKWFVKLDSHALTDFDTNIISAVGTADDTVESQSCWLFAGNSSEEPLNCDSVRAILVRGLHLRYYSLQRPTSRNQEPHRGTWFNMKPPRAILLYVPASEVKKPLRVLIQSKILTLSIVVSFDVQSTKSDQRSSDVMFPHRNMWHEIPESMISPQRQKWACQHLCGWTRHSHNIIGMALVCIVSPLSWNPFNWRF